MSSFFGVSFLCVHVDENYSPKKQMPCLYYIFILDCPKGKSLLYNDLEKRFAERAKQQKVSQEEEKKQKEQESLIKEQMEVGLVYA